MKRPKWLGKSVLAAKVGPFYTHQTPLAAAKERGGVPCLLRLRGVAHRGELLLDRRRAADLQGLCPPEISADNDRRCVVDLVVDTCAGGSSGSGEMDPCLRLSRASAAIHLFSFSSILRSNFCGSRCLKRATGEPFASPAGRLATGWLNSPARDVDSDMWKLGLPRLRFGGVTARRDIPDATDFLLRDHDTFGVTAIRGGRLVCSRDGSFGGTAGALGSSAERDLPTSSTAARDRIRNFRRALCIGNFGEGDANPFFLVVVSAFAGVFSPFFGPPSYLSATTTPSLCTAPAILCFLDREEDSLDLETDPDGQGDDGA